MVRLFVLHTGWPVIRFGAFGVSWFVARVIAVVRISALLSWMDLLDPYFRNKPTADLLNGFERLSEPLL